MIERFQFIHTQLRYCRDCLGGGIPWENVMSSFSRSVKPVSGLSFLISPCSSLSKEYDVLARGDLARPRYRLSTAGRAKAQRLNPTFKKVSSVSQISLATPTRTFK